MGGNKHPRSMTCILKAALARGVAVDMPTERTFDARRSR
uniref:Uncharacterized protein n=1 Tax=Mycetohabitans endofungorum TaxID=417203 RepID=A0A6B9HDE7_9BURK|nr:hypothetical protein [Mycetohabitans endofungorum]